MTQLNTKMFVYSPGRNSLQDVLCFYKLHEVYSLVLELNDKKAYIESIDIDKDIREAFICRYHNKN